MSLAACSDENHCDVAAGSYQTGEDGFLPGLSITIPAGWYLAEQDLDSLDLHPVARPDDHLLLWWDVRVVVSNVRAAPAGTIVESVGPTPDAFVRWFTTDPDFKVLQKPGSVTIAGVPGRTLALGISRTANYGDPGCPDNPRCADYVTDPGLWRDPYGTGGEVSDWLFLARVRNETGDHLFVVVLEGASPTDLTAFELEAKPIVDSIALPPGYGAG